jgi:hypothetical protein
VLVTALLLSFALGLGIVGYLALSQSALKLAHRSLFLNDATNLAEAGLEEAVYCFNQLNTGVAQSRAWTGWTLSRGAAMRTLPSFNRDQNGVGIVKVYVSGYDGSNPDPWVISQATITPFDGSLPVTKVLQVNLGRNSYFANGLVGIRGMLLRGDAAADSYHSNPTGRPSGPWARFATRDARGNTSVAIASGSLSATSRNQIRGDLYLGTDMSSSGVRVTGTTYPDFSSAFPFPEYPSNGTTVNFSRRNSRSWRSKSGNSGRYRGIDNNLPRRGDTPAADGWYYYFCDRTSIQDVTISPGAKVAIVGTNTKLKSGLVVLPGASCRIYIDGPVELTERGRGNALPVDVRDWAGALQIFTTTSRECTIETDRTMFACIFAPNARFTFKGDSNNPTYIVGSFIAGSVRCDDDVNFIYDEALSSPQTGKMWALSAWQELRTGADRSELGPRTNNFLP